MESPPHRRIVSLSLCFNCQSRIPLWCVAPRFSRRKKRGCHAPQEWKFVLGDFLCLSSDEPLIHSQKRHCFGRYATQPVPKSRLSVSALLYQRQGYLPLIIRQLTVSHSSNVSRMAMALDGERSPSLG